MYKELPLQRILQIIKLAKPGTISRYDYVDNNSGEVLWEKGTAVEDSPYFLEVNPQLAKMKPDFERLMHDFAKDSAQDLVDTFGDEVENMLHDASIDIATDFVYDNENEAIDYMIDEELEEDEMVMAMAERIANEVEKLMRRR